LIFRAALQHNVQMHSKQKKPRVKYDSSVALLQGVGLRPTRQRVALAKWLFDGLDKHVTAEQVHGFVLKKRMNISLATVYNTLNNFIDVGLLRRIVTGGGQVYFDTNMDDHHHLFDEEKSCLLDIPAGSVRFAKLPSLLKGKDLSRIDVVLRIRPAGKG